MALDKAFYGLLVNAGASNNTDYDTAGTNQTQKDVNTLNKALATIANRIKDEAGNAALMGKYCIFVHPELLMRVNQAIRTTVNDAAGSPRIIDNWNTSVVQTYGAIGNTNNISASKILIVYAGLGKLDDPLRCDT